MENADSFGSQSLNPAILSNDLEPSSLQNTSQDEMELGQQDYIDINSLCSHQELKPMRGYVGVLNETRFMLTELC